MQFTTGMQGDNAVLRLQVLPAIWREYIRIEVLAGYSQLQAELGALPVQGRVPLKAGQRLATLPGQQPAKVPLAGAPVEPVSSGVLPAMADAVCKVGDLLPFATGDVAAE